jgi:DNA-binding transcriptional regulator YhcF (GntR family)
MTDNEAPRVQVDYESGEKVYLQIARAIRDLIISGELPVGAQIPSGNRMKQEWGVNRLTGAQAVEELRRAGLLVTRPGVGTFVAATPRPGHSPDAHRRGAGTAEHRAHHPGAHRDPRRRHRRALQRRRHGDDDGDVTAYPPVPGRPRVRSRRRG